jgi:hypothetical protein
MSLKSNHVTSRNNVDEICSICLDNINNNNISITKCNHKFHLTCLFTSLNISNKCPLCREVVVINTTNNTASISLSTQTNNETEFQTNYNHVHRTYLLQE